MPFRAATYNVLADAYVKPQWYATVSPALFKPEGRLPSLVRHVESLGADLLCLREVELEVFAALQNRPPSGTTRRCPRRRSPSTTCPWRPSSSGREGR